MLCLPSDECQFPGELPGDIGPSWLDVAVSSAKPGSQTKLRYLAWLISDRQVVQEALLALSPGFAELTGHV